MKNKGKLLGFVKYDEQLDFEGQEPTQHQPMTYPGICSKNCDLLPNNCLCGIFDRDYIQKNVRAFD